MLIERRTRDRKVSSSNPGRSGGRIFFSRVNFVCWLLFGVISTPVLPQWHVKDPSTLIYSHFSWPMTLNKQLPWTTVWASLPVQLSNTSVQLVWREGVKQLSTTPLNLLKQGESWQRPYIEIRHVKMCEERKHCNVIYTYHTRSPSAVHAQRTQINIAPTFSIVMYEITVSSLFCEKGIFAENFHVVFLSPRKRCSS